MEKELNLSLDAISADFESTNAANEKPEQQQSRDNSISKAALISYLMS